MKIDRYYVDARGPEGANIVVRDHISPLANATYPTNIAVTVNTAVFKNRKEATAVAEAVCRVLNEESY